MKFSDVVIMTDVDGTLLTDDKQILQKDMDAINRFRDGGGIFTLATGRGFSMARPIADKLKLDVPAVIFNGAAVYDFSAEKFLWSSYMAPCAGEYIKSLIERFPHIAIEVLMERDVYIPAINNTERRHLALEHVQPVMCTADTLPDGKWLKVLIADEPKNIDKIRDFALENMTDNVRWVRSDAVYFEMLPPGISKWAGYEQMLRITGNENKFTVGAGDYNNDIEMIKNAELGVSVKSAPDEVKKIADLVVCDNNSGAMSEIINYIESI